MYRVEPESAPFEVAPFFGDIFSKNPLAVGRYVFDVVAIDSAAQAWRRSYMVIIGCI